VVISTDANPTEEQCLLRGPCRDVGDSGNNELVVGQPPAGKNLRTEVEDIVGIRHQTTTGEVIEKALYDL
jgi:hypothetical protein